MDKWMVVKTVTLFSKIVPFMTFIMLQNVLHTGRPQMAIWRIGVACWIPKATVAYTGCVHCLSCFGFFHHKSWQPNGDQILVST